MTALNQIQIDLPQGHGYKVGDSYYYPGNPETSMRHAASAGQYYVCGHLTDAISILPERRKYVRGIVDGLNAKLVALQVAESIVCDSCRGEIRKLIDRAEERLANETGQDGL